MHRTFQGSSNTSGFLGPQQISIPISKRWKNLPTCSHNLGRSLLPVKAIWFQLRLPGQHKGKLQPSADPSLFFQRLPQPTALAFASQSFLLLDKNGTNLFRKETCRLSEDWKSSSKGSNCWCRALCHEVVLTPENLWLTESERSPRAKKQFKSRIQGWNCPNSAAQSSGRLRGELAPGQLRQLGEN